RRYITRSQCGSLLLHSMKLSFTTPCRLLSAHLNLEREFILSMVVSSSRPKLVVENDSFLRLIQVILDPAAPADRFAAFAHFCAHDLPDFGGWCERIRGRVRDFYPADVRLVDNQAELLANVACAQVIVIESLAVGAAEIAAAGKTLTIVQND